MKRRNIALLVMTVALVSCRNGNGGAEGAPSGGTIQTKKLFVIMSDLSGDLKTAGSGASGPEGADNLCQADAQSAGGTYKALLVDGVHRVACVTANCSGGASEHVDWVLAPNTKYLRADDGETEVGTTNANGLFDFPLQNEWVSQGYDLWMGLKTDWTGDTNNCSGFTDSSVYGQVGMTGYKTSGAISNSIHSCNYYGTSILCIEQ